MSIIPIISTFYVPKGVIGMNTRVKTALKEFPLLTLGTALVALGVYFFKFPNNFSTGGVTGIAILLSAVFPAVSSSTFASILNILFLILGFLVLNKGFGVRTIYCSLLFSALLSGLEWLCPMSAPFTDQPLLELLFAFRHAISSFCASGASLRQNSIYDPLLYYKASYIIWQKSSKLPAFRTLSFPRVDNKKTVKYTKNAIFSFLFFSIYGIFSR